MAAEGFVCQGVLIDREDVQAMLLFMPGRFVWL